MSPGGSAKVDDEEALVGGGEASRGQGGGANKMCGAYKGRHRGETKSLRER